MSRTGKVAVSVLLAIGGVLIATAIGGGEPMRYPAPDADILKSPSLSVEYRPGLLHISGNTASAEHEKQLLRVASASYSNTVVDTDFKPHTLPPEHWQRVSGALVALLADARAADAHMAPGEIRVAGIVTLADDWAQGLDRFRAALPAGMRISADMTVIAATAPLAEQCRHVFSDVTTGSVEFRESSSDIRSSSFAVLDRLVNFSRNCPHAGISITGHSDASGSEAGNLQLSLQRARAVANYLERRGVAANRLVVTGAGSMVPVADNSTARGRELNRRIEFELLEPAT